jgi:SAM-dependent methyltransferase
MRTGTIAHLPEIPRDSDMAIYFEGNKLYGDDFNSNQIADWFHDEAKAYSMLGSGDRNRYSYGYHALNHRHGFRHLPERIFQRVLGLGSAYGDELLPLMNRMEEITIVEPCGDFTTSELAGHRLNYIKPHEDGSLHFEDNAFDLVICLGVLHHVPNVRAVLSEISRCLAPGGFALVREPIISMGDWRYPRRGITQRERGIPEKLFLQLIVDSGLEIVNMTPCVFFLTGRITRMLPDSAFNYKWTVFLDEWACRLPILSKRYHAKYWWQKFRATSLYCVLRKPSLPDKFRVSGKD